MSSFEPGAGVFVPDETHSYLAGTVQAVSPKDGLQAKLQSGAALPAMRRKRIVLHCRQGLLRQTKKKNLIFFAVGEVELRVELQLAQLEACRMPQGGVRGILATG